MDRKTSRTWAEIDLKNLDHNYHVLRGLLPPSSRFVGVIKANAYGHGDVEIARRLEQLGADYLAVASLDEAVELRKAEIQAPILILGGTNLDDARFVICYHLTQTIFDVETAKKLSQEAVAQKTKIKVHAKIDTGMSRLGFFCDETSLRETAQTIAELHQLPGLDWEGIYTHFADADTKKDYTVLQASRFHSLLDVLKKEYNITFPIRHCAASSAVLKFSDDLTDMNMARPGLALYGYYPDPSCRLPNRGNLVPVMTLKTRMVSIKKVPSGTPVSYGCTCTLEKDTNLAVLPIGYGDGLPRLCSNQLKVWLLGKDGKPGKKIPILGRICMDMCMADVTDCPDAQMGDEVEIYGPNAPMEDAASLAQTIPYELLCNVSPRVPRIYL